jgi:hypothetical protein
VRQLASFNSGSAGEISAISGVPVIADINAINGVINGTYIAASGGVGPTPAQAASVKSLVTPFGASVRTVFFRLPDYTRVS